MSRPPATLHAPRRSSWATLTPRRGTNGPRLRTLTPQPGLRSLSSERGAILIAVALLDPKTADEVTSALAAGLAPERIARGIAQGDEALEQAILEHAAQLRAKQRQHERALSAHAEAVAKGEATAGTLTITHPDGTKEVRHDPWGIRRHPVYMATRVVMRAAANQPARRATPRSSRRSHRVATRDGKGGDADGGDGPEEPPLGVEPVEQHQRSESSADTETPAVVAGRAWPEAIAHVHAHRSAGGRTAWARTQREGNMNDCSSCNASEIHERVALARLALTEAPRTPATEVATLQLAAAHGLIAELIERLEGVTE